MNYECQVCFARFNETDMNREEQKQQICPNCGHVDLKVITETETAKEEAMLKCPLLRAGHIACPEGFDLDWRYDNCMLQQCAWWNSPLGMCALAVDAFLRGREVEVKETQTQGQRGAG